MKLVDLLNEEENFGIDGKLEKVEDICIDTLGKSDIRNNIREKVIELLEKI